MKQRIKALILALTIALALLPAAALAAGVPTVTLNKSDYYPYELLKFTVANAAAASGTAYVYKADGTSTNSWKALEDFSGAKQIRLPEEPGSYELRIVNGPSRGAPVLCTALFTVTKPPYRTDGKVTIEILALDDGMGYPEFFVNGPAELDNCVGMIMLKTAVINDSGYGYGTFRFGIVKTAWDRKPERPEDYELRLYTEVNSQTRKLLARQPLVFVPWSEASSWATAELKKADDLGLIPDSLRGADLTAPITREEFAEVAVLLYDKVSGKASLPVSPNPFTDTANPQVLKAFNAGIVKGTSDTTFSPKELTNREQVATMLSRAIRVLAPGGDFSTAGAPAFDDQQDISDFALEHVLYMAKQGIIKGTDGKFMPKATTAAEVAAGYAATTREQAILMSVRSFEKMDTIKGTSGNNTTAAPAEASAAAVVGTWLNGSVSGQYNTALGRYEGPSGMGLMYTFNADGTFAELIAFGTYTVTTGKYSIKDGLLTLTDRVSEDSNDTGKTWSEKEALPDASSYFSAGTDDSGKYLLLGREGATPPLNPPTNAVKLRLKE